MDTEKQFFSTFRKINSRCCCAWHLFKKKKKFTPPPKIRIKIEIFYSILLHEKAETF